MTTEQETVPAGAELSEDAAATLILSSIPEEDRETDNPEPETPSNEPDGERGEIPGAEADETPREGETPEDDYYDFDKISPDTQIRLRDGRVVRFGDVKRDWAELQEISRHKQELEQTRSQFQQQAQQIAQQAQFFQQTVPMALQVLQANLGEPPQAPVNDPLDPIGSSERWNEYNQRSVQYQANLQRIQQLQSAQQQHMASQRQKMEAEFKTYLKNEQDKLLSALPVLRDEAKRSEFKSDFYKYGTSVYGFSDQELDQAYDHRLVLMARDAIAWRKLQTQKPKAAEKAKDAPPVREPGKRVSEGEQKARKYQEGLTRLRKSGGVDDAVALILNDLA